MRKTLIYGFVGYALLLLLGILSLPVIERVVSTPVDAQQVTRFQVRGHFRSFDALSAVGATAEHRVNGASDHNVHLIVTGAPATCTGRLQGTNDGTNWYNITASDITCTSTIASATASVPTLAVRFNLLTLTGGTTPTITAHYAGQ